MAPDTILRTNVRREEREEINREYIIRGCTSRRHIYQSRMSLDWKEKNYLKRDFIYFGKKYLFFVIG